MRQEVPVASWVDLSEKTQPELDRYKERRALIESHVWGTFMSARKPTQYLPSINDRFAKTIEAALNLGDVGLLKPDLSWIEQLLMDYRLSENTIAEYIAAYYQAARVHLGDSASVVNWLSLIAPD